MEIPTKYKIAGVVVLTAVAFASGRYSVPEKVRVETKIVEVEKKVKDVDTDLERKKRKTYTKTVITKPDGSKEEKTVITDNVDTDQKKIEKDITVDQKRQDTINETVRGDSKVTISALGGLNINSLTPVYGLSVSKPVFGPVTLGVWGLSDTSCGVSVGITF